MKVTFGCNEGDIARHFLNVLTYKVVEKLDL